MKKLTLLLLMFVSILSFQSCTDVSEDEEILFEVSATDKEDSCNTAGCGQGGVEDEEDDD